MASMRGGRQARNHLLHHVQVFGTASTAPLKAGMRERSLQRRVSGFVRATRLVGQPELASLSRTSLAWMRPIYRVRRAFACFWEPNPDRNRCRKAASRPFVLGRAHHHIGGDAADLRQGTEVVRVKTLVCRQIGTLDPEQVFDRASDVMAFANLCGA